ncbi:MAG TPA: aminoacyl-tRNA hydrolase [Spirochaetia bacterium]|nr:aminoacyl-tRNA hydrolase [Spirochaetia bacterium]
MVVGLGNPGDRYSATRHNVGFQVVDELAGRLGISFRRKLLRSYSIGKGSHGGAPLFLVKPLTFMNDSGRAVREALRESGSGPADLLVVCDSLDISPGNVRFRLQGSSGGQKGLQSIINALGTEDFMRLVIGIGRPAHKGQVVGHVLTAPRRGEAALVEEAVVRAADAVQLLLTDGPRKVMNEFNRKEPPS